MLLSLNFTSTQRKGGHRQTELISYALLQLVAPTVIPSIPEHMNDIRYYLCEASPGAPLGNWRRITNIS
jgi:hypothetical protein